MRTQAELTTIWDDIGRGAYGTDPNTRKPTKVVDSATEQVMSVPTPDGHGLEHYSRRQEGDWEKTKYVGQS